MTDIPFTIPSKRRFDVVGFGTNAVDHLVTVPSYPAFDSKVEIVSHSMAAGGEIASTMVGLQRLGLITAYAGRFGDDAEGLLGKSSLDDEGVDISQTQTIHGARTQIAYIVIDAATGERTVMWHRDKALAYTAVEAPIELASECRILHMTPHDAAASVKMAEAARVAGTIVSLDLDNNFDGLDDLLPLIDVCVISSDFPNRFFGITDPKEALTRLADYGCPIVGCTLGEQGSIFYVNGEYVASPAAPVPGGCVDTTGAGDAFRAGFLYGLLDHRSIEDCSQLANTVAALKCSHLGARTGLPGLDDLKKGQKNLFT